MRKNILQPSDAVSESKKKSPEWLKDNIDFNIYSCINPYRDDDIRAYQIINGQRDLKKYAHITKTYGLEFPAKLSHIPLIKTYLEELIGEERMMPISQFKIALRDSLSIDGMRKSKVKSILSHVDLNIKKTLQQNAARLKAQGQGQDPQPKQDYLSEDSLKQIEEFHTYTWKDFKAIAGEKALRHLKERCDIQRKKNMMFRDLVITGKEFYRVQIVEMGRDPETTICNPLNIYFQGGEDIFYLRDCDRVVYKEYITVTEAINRYGHFMKPEEIKSLEERNENVIFSGVSIYDTSFTKDKKTVTGGQPMYATTADLVEVCHCEWKSNTRIVLADNKEIDEATEAQMIEMGEGKKIKVKYRMDRYSGIRVGANIYVKAGLDKHIVRSADNPWNCSLTFNGACYNKRNSKPYSLVLATEDLQDKYDILNYYLENHIALSGTRGTRIILENIPKQFGKGITERIKKFMYYKKSGLEIHTISQDGASPDFSNYGTYDDTISPSVDVIIRMMQFLEQAASRITGVPPQRIGSIQKNELVGNTEVAVNQSLLTTKPLFALHGDLVKEMLVDILNAAKYSWKDSPKKSFVLGEELNEIFTLDPKMISEVDYDIILSDSGLELKQIEEMKGMANAMIQNQMIDLETVLDITTIDSITELKKKVQKSARSNSAGKIKQAEQMVAEANAQIEKLTKQLQAVENQEMQLKEKELAITEKKSLKELEIKERKVASDDAIGKEANQIDRERVRLEQLEITYSPSKREVKNK